MCVYNAMYSMVPLPLSSLPRLAAISGEGAEQSGASRGIQTVAHGREPPQVPLGPPPVQSQDHVRGSTWNQTQYPENLYTTPGVRTTWSRVTRWYGLRPCLSWPGSMQWCRSVACSFHRDGPSSMNSLCQIFVLELYSIIDRLCAKPGLNVKLFIYHTRAA